MVKKIEDEDLEDDLDIDDGDDSLDDDDNISPEEPEADIDPSNIDHSLRTILVCEPIEEHRATILEILNELLPGANIVDVEDIEAAAEIFVEDEYDTIILDLRHEGFAASEFVKLANNDPDVMIVAFSVDCMDLSDDKSKSKYEPLRKLFELDKNLKQSKS